MLVNFAMAVLFALFVGCALRADYLLARATSTGNPRYSRRARLWLAVAGTAFGLYAWGWFCYV